MSLKSAFIRARRVLTGVFGASLAHRMGADWSQTRAPLSDADRVMLSHTHAWLRGMPNGIHPKQLCRHYPRVANRIAMGWHDLPLVDRLLLDLMVDRRGDRLGFPPRIRQEIDRLYGYHAKRMTPLLRGRPAGHAAMARTAAEPARRVRLRTPMSVSSIKR
jgi:hypothetical protein